MFNLKQKQKVIFVIFSVLVLGFVAHVFWPERARGATVIWDGGGDDQLWSNCLNWSDNVCPTASDVVVFNNTSVEDATIDAGFGGTVSGFTIEATYNGAITQERSLTISSSGFSQAGGTFNGGSQNIDINGTTNGNFSVTGGTFNSTTGTLSIERNFTNTAGTFNHNGGTVQFDGNSGVGNSTVDVATSLDFNNITINKQGTIAAMVVTSGDTVVVLGTFNMNNGSCNTGTVDTRSTITIAADSKGGTCLLDFGSAGAQSMTIASGGTAPHVRLNHADDASDSITMSGSAGFTGFTVTADFSGAIPLSNPTNAAVTFGTSGLTLATATLNISSYVSATFHGNITLSGTAVLTPPASVSFTNSTGTVIDVVDPLTFTNVTIQKSLNNELDVADGDVVIVAGTLTLTDGLLFGELQVEGNITQSANFDGGTGRIDFTSPAAQVYTVNGGIAPPIRLDNDEDASDSIVLNAAAEFDGFTMTSDFTQSFAFTNPSNFDITMGNFSQAGGIFNGGNYIHRHEGTFTITNGAFNAPTTFLVQGTSANANYNVNVSATFNNFTLNKTNAINIASGDTLIVTGTLRLVNGSILGPGALEARGNVEILSTLDTNTAPLIFSGSSASGLATQTWDLTGATSIFNADVTINKTEGEVRLLSAFVADASNQDLIIAEGKLNINGQNVTVSGTNGTFVVQDGGNLQLFGSETLTTPTLQSGSTVTYTGDGGADSDTYTITTLASTYHHLVINSTDGASDTFTLGAALTVSGNLTVTAGTLDANSNTPRNINLAGNWSNGGTFVPRTATVTFTGGNQQISGSTTFNNLAKSVSSTATLTFEAEERQVVTGTLTLTGQSDATLSLRSSVEDTQWEIDPQGTRTIDYLDVQDSNNVNAAAMDVEGLNINDSGNNTNWGFNTAPGTPTGLGPAAYIDGSWGNDNTPTLGFTLDDEDEGSTVQFRIQIDDSSNFGSLVVDYTSALGAVGAKTFTVGQAAAGGTYAVGTEGQSLSDGSYYWRVMSIDNEGAESDFITANFGNVAFRVDTVAPDPGSLSLATRTTTSITVEVSGASDEASGLASNPYNFANTTASTASGAQSETTWESGDLSVNTSYTFTVTVTDVAGNTATSDNFTRYTLARPPSNLILTVDSPESITATWDANGNPEGTEYEATNFTAATNSGWITEREWTSDELEADTEYIFIVKARNGDDVETSSVLESAETSTENSAPNSPSTLGPNSYVDGSWGNDDGPTFTFIITDPDEADQVQFRIQIDDTADFSSPVVDYTSSFGQEGGKSFTVGQGAFGGTYTIGSSGQALSDSNGYYWRVKAIDAQGAESAYNTAHGGAVAFKLDTEAPSTGTFAVLSRSTSSITVGVDGAADALSGLANSPYLFSNTTAGTNSGATGDTSWNSQNLSENTSYAFSLVVSDIAGNTAAAALNGSTLSGGGGLPPEAYNLPLEPLGVEINNGQQVTQIPQVLLRLVAGSNVAGVALAYSDSFTGAVIETYAPYRLWNVCQSTACTPGLKTVYVKFFTKYGQQSNVYTASILYDPDAPASEVPLGHDVGDNIKDPNGTVYFITYDSLGRTVRRPYTSLGAFISYGFNLLSTVRTANASDLLLPEGEFVPPQDGTVFCARETKGSDVKGECALITKTNKASFVSQTVFRKLGFAFSRAITGDSSFLKKTANIETEKPAHLPGVLVAIDRTIYLVGPEGLYGIPSLAVFNSWGYSLLDVVEANEADKELPIVLTLEMRQAHQLQPY